MDDIGLAAFAALLCVGLVGILEGLQHQRPVFFRHGRRGILHFSQICLIIFLVGHQMQRITHYKPSLARVSFFKITEPLMSALPSNRGRRMLTSSSVMV